ncbi:hypothetical protein HOD29_02880 [archaeon]|jgi:hypothetical protein|nr:hypothetical protein [archaeon]
MKKIGSGLQFNVYDLGNGKVLKKPKKDIAMYFLNLIWEPYLIFAPWILKKRIVHARGDRKEAINYFSKNPFNKSLIANLVINEDRIFQDKVHPISKEIGFSFEKGKRLIDSYYDLIFKMWKQGFAEKVYKFVENYGVNSRGEVVLIDFAEMRFSKEDVAKDILRKRWMKVNSDKRKIKGKLRKYYKQKMEELLTIKNLERYWGNENEKNI